MDTDEFWQHIDTLRAGRSLPGSAVSYNKRLRALLKRWNRDQLMTFDGHLRAQLARAMQRPVWISAMLFNDGICDDETFLDYRCWLVSLGKRRFEEVLDSPDVLADIVQSPHDSSDVRLHPLFWSTKRLIDAAFDVRDIAAGLMQAKLSLDSLPVIADESPPLGEMYWSIPEEPEVLSIMPRLRARFGNVRMRQHPLLAAYVRSADIPRLGTVTVGDWLTRNGSQRRLRVVAVMDEGVTVNYFGGTRLTGGEGRFVARMQDERGITGSYRLNQSCFHWPHQPDPGIRTPDRVPTTPSPAEPKWNLRIEAIQARIAQALGKAPRIRYAAYDLDGEELPIDNLDDCAHQGRIVFRWFDDTDGSEGRSEVLSSPTWLQLTCTANAMLEILEDAEHVYLEGIDVVGWEDDAAVAEFVMGS